jgi:hypothetical protein
MEATIFTGWIRYCAGDFKGRIRSSALVSELESGLILGNNCDHGVATRGSVDRIAANNGFFG